MQEFFMDYGLWLLIGLLVVIGLVFLLSGRGKGSEPQTPVAPTLAPRPPQSPAPVADPAPIDVIPAVEVASPTVIPDTALAPSVVADPTPSLTPRAADPGAAQDDLLRMKGIGPKLQTLLIELGVTRYAQIAAWTDADLATIDARLGNFKGRPVRDQWVDQAKYLAADDIAGFEAKYGKL